MLYKREFHPIQNALQGIIFYKLHLSMILQLAACLYKIIHCWPVISLNRTDLHFDSNKSFRLERTYVTNLTAHMHDMYLLGNYNG